jgi:hypothetical protein
VAWRALALFQCSRANDNFIISKTAAFRTLHHHRHRPCAPALRRRILLPKRHKSQTLSSHATKLPRRSSPPSPWPWTPKRSSCAARRSPRPCKRANPAPPCSNSSATSRREFTRPKTFCDKPESVLQSTASAHTRTPQYKGLQQSWCPSGGMKSRRVRRRAPHRRSRLAAHHPHLLHQELRHPRLASRRRSMMSLPTSATTRQTRSSTRSLDMKHVTAVSG